MLLGECENRLACILASIPMFWPVIEQAAGRFHELYRVFVTHEFSVGSSRILPGEACVEVGAYEAPHWAEEEEDDRERDDRGRGVNSSASSSCSRGGSVKGGGGGKYGHEREEDALPSLENVQLPQWPSSVRTSRPGSKASDRSARDSEV